MKKRRPVEKTKTYEDALGIIKYLKDLTKGKLSLTMSEILKKCAQNGWSHNIAYAIIDGTIFKKDENGDIVRVKPIYHRDVEPMALLYADAVLIKNAVACRERNKRAETVQPSVSSLPKDLPKIPPKSQSPVVQIATSKPDLFTPVWDNSIPDAITLLKKNGYKVYKIETIEKEI